MCFKIGPYTLSSRILLAPMAGVTDAPYRKLCHQFGAGLTPAEMITSDPSLRESKKTQQRLLQTTDTSPRSVQIVGTEPDVMAQAAQFNADLNLLIKFFIKIEQDLTLEYLYTSIYMWSDMKL